MSRRSANSPDVLVLGGGGILGEAWMSAVLAGLREATGLDPLGCGCYIGTSAGSIVAASLVAGIDPASRLGSLPEQPAVDLEQGRAGDEGRQGGTARQVLGAAAGIGGAAIGPLASLALNSTRPGGALLRRSALRRVPAGTRSLEQLRRAVERSGVTWDGRLQIAAVELQSGRRVMFGTIGAPRLGVPEAVEASCAIPGVFAPVRAGGRSYVDGGVWSPTNMDAANVRAGEVVLCLNPTGSLRPQIGSLIGAIGPVSRAIAGAEALALRARGALVSTVSPDRASAAAMGSNLMDPRRRERVIQAGLGQGRALAGRDLLAA